MRGCNAPCDRRRAAQMRGCAKPLAMRPREPGGRGRRVVQRRAAGSVENQRANREGEPTEDYRYGVT
jgi:hypothetical protein